MSGIYPTLESAQAVLSRDPHQRPLSGTGYAVAVTHPNGPPTWAYIPGYAYECDTSKAAHGTGADLSIHSLEPTIAQRPYTVVRTSPCSRNPFLTLRRPAKLRGLCKPRVQVEEQDLMRSSISRLPPTRTMRGAAQWCMQIGC